MPWPGSARDLAQRAEPSTPSCPEQQGRARVGARIPVSFLAALTFSSQL